MENSIYLLFFDRGVVSVDHMTGHVHAQYRDITNENRNRTSYSLIVKREQLQSKRIFPFAAFFLFKRLFEFFSSGVAKQI